MDKFDKAALRLMRVAETTPPTIDQAGAVMAFLYRAMAPAAQDVWRSFLLHGTSGDPCDCGTHAEALNVAELMRRLSHCDPKATLQIDVIVREPTGDVVAEVVSSTRHWSVEDEGDVAIINIDASTMHEALLATPHRLRVNDHVVPRR